MTAKEYNDCVKMYADNVYRFILKNLRHEEDSRDVVQSSFEKLWINREKVDNEPQQQLKKVLNDALNRLNETQRSLVLLKDYEGYSYEEISEITSLSQSQVKVYLHRARIQLKNYLVKPENVI